MLPTQQELAETDYILRGLFNSSGGIIKFDSQFNLE